MSALLEVRDLTVTLQMDAGPREVITGTSLEIAGGEAMGLVGESGSGKSMTAKAIARLLPQGATTTGSVSFDGTDVLALSGSALLKHRAQNAPREKIAVCRFGKHGNGIAVAHGERFPSFCTSTAMCPAFSRTEKHLS